MGLFEEAMNEGEKYAREHPDQVNKEMGDAEKWADERTGDKYDSEVQSIGNEAERRLEGQ